MVVGKVGENANYFIYIEDNVATISKHFKEAIFDLFCFYYILDIQYPKPLKSLFLFFQCCMLNIHTEDLKKPPPGLSKLLQALNNV